MLVDIHSTAGLDELPVVTLPGGRNECWRCQVLYWHCNSKLCTTLYTGRRTMSARCRQDCNEGHCREEMMEETLSG